ncbi:MULTISPECIES: hypothetical protein [Maribacter]|uniref:DUF885 domain-containing protein n=1 Tax=Maribacter flavus TaxID=1658664 RepID=A0ABU7IG17_9FLAO|nr:MULTISPECIES: hypothetical protein [Maribacter]MDC6405302.1 hypothetical protein [Maribacter sp. PR66]MEE1971889.1 hypothetical protein [Maribacter flavus]
MKTISIIKKSIFHILFVFLFTTALNAQNSSNTYQDLTAFFKEWRTFENPPLRDGAPDYTQETFDKRWPAFQTLHKKLQEMDTTGWSIPDQVDWRIVNAEMNGYDFNHRILKPWQRDPAFYATIWTARSDVPAHEGPTHHAIIDLWTYNFPLDKEQRTKLLAQLTVIPPLNEQAKLNLTGNAKDLWIAGIRDIKTQSKNLEDMKVLPGISKDRKIVKAIEEAIASTNNLASWLEAEASNKTGPSGIGKENYTWYLQNVHLVPLTWEDEVMILKRELSRAWSALKLEEHRNRNLPQLTDANSPEEYDRRAKAAAKSLLDFLDKNEMVTVKDYFEPALNAHLGGFVPRETRNFFWITAHYDQRPLYSHFYHWFELARMDTEPHASEIRRTPLLYNIFDSRNEGTATAVEEMFMDAGLYDDSSRSREIVYIMIAQRAARGLGSLYAHANMMTMKEAGGIHSEYTPRGWMKTEKELLLFEQHLYLRQPGYGTSYITGKYLLENTMAEYARMKEAKNKPFEMRAFFDELNSVGSIPISLGRWQMTGVENYLGQEQR